MNSKIVVINEEKGCQTYYYDITHIIKNIFGDFVIKALLKIDSKYNWVGKSHEDVSNEVLQYANKYNLDDQLDSIDFDGKSIIVEFDNGNKAWINCSEWGNIDKI